MVTMLQLNLRTPGILGTILLEMREQRVTDSSYKLLQSRQLGMAWENGVLERVSGPNEDPRLQQPPFPPGTVDGLFGYIGGPWTIPTPISKCG